MMKAISIKQPWANLIVHGIKNIENRTWKCPQKYIGQRVLIHASKAKSSSLFNELNLQQNKIVEEHFKNNAPLLIEPLGYIIGSVVIKDCIKDHPSVWAEKEVYNWVLEDAILFDKPLPAKGKLNFWDFSFKDCK